MKINTYTRVVLNSIIAVFFSPRLIHTVSSLSNDKIDHTRTAHQKNPVEVIVGDAQDFMGQKQHTGSVPGLLRIPGRTRARDPPVEDDLSKYTHLPDVSVICSSSGLVLRVKKSFYGFSAAPEELTLGKTCKSNGALEPLTDLLFTYALTDCQSERQVLPELIVYKFVLHYVPMSERHFRSHRVNVGVECRFKRNHHVHGEVLKPTWWIPLRKIIRSRSGDFRMRLMDDSWSSPVRSAVYLLGQKINVQVSTQHHQPGVKLFINSCHVTTTNSWKQVIKYSIIDNYGCLRESLIHPDATFRFSRADNIVQFSFTAFQFIEAPDAQVSLHCELFVSGGGLSSVQKSCFYNHEENRWMSVFGQDSICDCCDSVCNQTKTKRLISEGFVSSDQVVFTHDETSQLSASAFSTLNFTRSAHDDGGNDGNDGDDEAIWFEAKPAKEPQRSHDFIASVTLRSSEGRAKIQNESHVSSVAREEMGKIIEEEQLEDVEILMATSKSFVRSERPKVNTRFKSKETIQKLDSMERDTTLSLTEHKMLQNRVKEQRYHKQEVLGKGKVPMKTSLMVSETIEERVLGDGDLDFPVGLDELVEQGVVRRLEVTNDPDFYVIPEET